MQSQDRQISVSVHLEVYDSTKVPDRLSVRLQAEGKAGFPKMPVVCLVLACVLQC